METITNQKVDKSIAKLETSSEVELMETFAVRDRTQKRNQLETSSEVELMETVGCVVGVSIRCLKLLRKLN